MTQKIIANRYILKRELGAGGMGKVYLGEDTHNHQEVAIKELHSNLTDEELITRFKREGEALRDLDHPNIVKMLNAIDENGKHYLIMEYISGGDLSNLLDAGQVPIEKILNIAIDLADALTRAHRLNIIHRDLKPANILIGEDGILRLTDFGVAHIGSKERVTETDVIVGTLDYLPPEAFEGKQYDERGDIWAFGVILFEMIAGKRPFEGETIIKVIQAIATGTIPDLEQLRPDASTDLVDLIYRMLERDPYTRLPSVRHVGATLEDILKGRDTSAQYEVGRFDTPITTTSYPKKDNLPQQTSIFVGREAELAELDRILAAPEIRLITIIAPGGMGKTSLSIELARRSISQFEDGVFFVELASLTNPDQIVSTIADVMDFQFIPGERSHKEQLLEFLTNRQQLLVMDNFEHLLDGSNIVSDILKTNPQVKVIATSRQPLKVSGESLFHLSGMDFPDWETPEDTLEYASVKLFVNSAVRALPSFELGAENLDYVARICRLVQGMPLGIVLAASWLAMLSPKEIVAEMQQNMDILEDETGQVPERQRSIRAVMDYSWQIMSEAEQDVFMKLSVFRGGFTREVAQEIASANIRILMSLTIKSLIHRHAENGRYQVHELLRQYAEEKLKQAESFDKICSKHSAYYLDLLAQNTTDLKGGVNQFKILDRLDDDFENIEVAWKHATLQQDAIHLERAMEGLELLCNFRSHFDEAQHLFDSARKAQLPEALKERVKIRFTGSTMTQVDLEQALEAAKNREDETEYAYCLVKLGEFAHNVSKKPQQAINYWEEAVTLYRKLGEGHYLAETLMKLSDPYQHVNDYQKSGSAVQQSYEIQQEHRDDLGAAKTFRALAMDAMMRGSFETHNTFMKQGYDLYYRAKNLAGQAETLNFIGQGIFMGGQTQEGIQQVEQAVELAKDIGLNTLQAWASSALSFLSVMANDLPGAERWLEETNLIEVNSLQQAGGGGALLSLQMLWAKGLIAVAQNNYDQAQVHLLPALEMVYQMHGIGIMMLLMPIFPAIYTSNTQYERAVELIGLVDTLGTDNVGWVEQWSIYSDIRNQVRQKLGEVIYKTAFERGKSMDLMMAVKQILDELDNE